MKYRIAVYGSLRMGMYNYKAFASNLMHKATITLAGYTLHPLFGGAYPGINPSDNDEHTIEVDLFEITDTEDVSAERAFNRIHGMELGAGYRPVTITVDKLEYTLYVYSDTLPKDSIIEDGDWVSYKALAPF